MEKKAQLYEIIIKCSFAIMAFIMSIFVVKNIISIIPLLKSFSFDEITLYREFYSTHIGEIIKDMGIINRIDFLIIMKGFTSFLLNIEWIMYLLLIMTMCLLIIRFIFLKWTLVKQYIKISSAIIISYFLKYLIFALCFAIFYKGGIKSMSLSFVVGSSFYIIISIIELFFLSLFIIKFIFNIYGDLKYYCAH